MGPLSRPFGFLAFAVVLASLILPSPGWGEFGFGPGQSTVAQEALRGARELPVPDILQVASVAQDPLTPPATPGVPRWQGRWQGRMGKDVCVVNVRFGKDRWTSEARWYSALEIDIAKVKAEGPDLLSRFHTHFPLDAAEAAVTEAIIQYARPSRSDGKPVFEVTWGGRDDDMNTISATGYLRFDERYMFSRVKITRHTGMITSSKECKELAPAD